MISTPPCSLRLTNVSLSVSMPFVLGSTTFSFGNPRAVRLLSTALTAAAVLRSRLGE